MGDGNRFVDHLMPDDRQALEPLLRPVVLRPGQVVTEQGATVEDIYFPIDAQFTNQTRFQDGSAIETAVVGCEGLTGLAPFIANTPSAWEIVARVSGRAWAAEATRVRALAYQRPGLMARLLKLVDFYQAQAAQSAACNATHQALPRIARWLLVALDLSSDGRIQLTQDELARLLGAQRTTVSQAANQLKQAGMISYSRGVVHVVNQAKLESVACECHAYLRQRMADIGLGVHLKAK